MGTISTARRALPYSGKNIFDHLRHSSLAVLSESLRVRSIPLTGIKRQPISRSKMFTKYTPHILLQHLNTYVQVTIVNTVLIVAVLFIQ